MLHLYLMNNIAQEDIMILLQANQIARHFGSDILFENIQLEIQDRSRIALVGKNGAGKSTLLKIIAGIEEPDVGHISKSKQVSIGYLAQSNALQSQKSVWDEMLEVFSKLQKMEKHIHQLEQKISETIHHESTEYQQLLNQYEELQHQFQLQNGYGYEAEIRSILSGFRFDESYYTRSIATLSGGQKTRLALAKLLLEKPDLLILDEPTNHLDIQTLTWLENYLQNYSGALLIVSHDRYFLDKVVTEIYDLTHNKLYHYKGDYSHFLEQKEQRYLQELSAFEKQQAEIKKIETFVQKNIVRASTTKRAQSRRKQLEKMDKIERPKGKEKSARFLFDIARTSGNRVLNLEEAAIGYETTILSEPINLNIRKQEAIALVGPNGVGKSTLLKSIIGELPFIKGTAILGTNVDIGYYDQEQTQLHSTKTILQELWDEHTNTPEKEIRTVLGSFLFSGDDVEKTIPLLSGGEKARLALAKLSMQKENFLILDEPTNHLDLDSKEVLEQALIDYEGTLLFVSHDRYFINRIATKVLELSKTGIKLYLGDYNYYLEKKAEEEELALLKNQDINTSSQNVPADKHSFHEIKEQQKKQRTLTRKIEQLEEQLTEIELLIESIQVQMNQPDILEDHVKLQDMHAELVIKQNQQEELLTEWEIVSLELENFSISSLDE